MNTSGSIEDTIQNAETLVEAKVPTQASVTHRTRFTVTIIIGDFMCK